MAANPPAPANSALSVVTEARSTPTAVVTAASSGGDGGVLGGDQAVEANADQNGAGIPQAWRIDNMSAGTAGSISFYVDSGNAATGMSVGLYSNSNGHPGRLLAQGTVSSLTRGAWNKVTLGTQPTLTAGTYWIAAVGTGGALGFSDRVSGSCDTEVSGMQGLTSLQGAWSQGQLYSNSYCPVSAYVNGASSGESTSPSNTTAPAISGTPQQGDALTVSNGSWSGSTPMTFSYQWQDCTPACADIQGATSKSYTLRASDVGDTIDAVVTATNGVGSSSSTSATVGPVTAAQTGQPVGDPLGKAWTRAFDAEFNGTSINSSKWISLNYWYLNNENVSPADCSESGGNLVLSLPGDGTGCDLATDQNGLDSYALPVGGYLEARVWFPGPGSSPTSTLYNWPAIWALGHAPSGGSGEPGGEIDFAEALNNLQINYHSDTVDKYVATPPGQWGNSWHVYGVYRGATQDEIFWDGNLVGTVKTADNGSPESIILTSGGSNACCGAPSQTGSAGDVLVDWVRAWG